MTLYDNLINAGIGLEALDFGDKGTIELQNDADETGDYIAKWEYEKPIPEGFKLGK